MQERKGSLNFGGRYSFLTADKGMSSGRFTKKEESQPKEKRQLEGNLNRGSCHSFHTADTWEQEPKHVLDLLKEQDQIWFHANQGQ
jgi:hypothetical protein